MTIPKILPTANHVYVVDADTNSLIMDLTPAEAEALGCDLRLFSRTAKALSRHPAGRNLRESS